MGKEFHESLRWFRACEPRIFFGRDNYYLLAFPCNRLRAFGMGKFEQLAKTVFCIREFPTRSPRGTRTCFFLEIGNEDILPFVSPPTGLSISTSLTHPSRLAFARLQGGLTSQRASGADHRKVILTRRLLIFPICVYPHYARAEVR